MVYDIFLSYPRAEQGPVTALKQALEALGLSVWMDIREIADGVPVTGSIVEGLARSRVLLAWYAPAYALSRPCQWELTAAYLAAQQEGGKVGQRLLIVNPVAGTAHVGQAHLTDCQHLSGRGAVAELAARVRDAVDRALSPFAHIRALTAPPWPAGPRRSGSNRFVGRIRELWDIHNGLIAGDLAVISGKPAGNDLVRVHGMGGIGKSLLAEEYALRFGAAYPGGIFWLSASPPDSSTTPEQQYQGQMLDLAQRLGMEIAGQSFAVVQGMLRRHLEGVGSYLWVVDDLPSGVKAELLHCWQAPSAQGKTLVTSRSGGLSGNGQAIPLDRLDDTAAFELLTGRCKPTNEEERKAAREILCLLGNHALAVDVTGAALSEVGFVPLQARLQNPSDDALALAAELVDELPNGHEKEVSATLLSSITRLSAGALNVMKIVSLLAEEPIPRNYIAKVFTRAVAPRHFIDRMLVSIGFIRKPDPLLLESSVKNALEENLLERIGEHYISAHVLVCRTIRYYQPPGERLRKAAVAIMKEQLDAASDIKRHPLLVPLVPHAMALIWRRWDAISADIMNSIAKIESARRDYRMASIMTIQEYLIREEIQGVEHKDTKNTLKNMEAALMYFAESPPPSGRDANEINAVLVLQGVVNGLISMGKWNEALDIQLKAHSEYLRKFGSNHPDTQEIARVLRKMQSEGPT